jgi:two-component system, cell cycle sensor histidine kinase and response regulator CckA
MRALIVDDHSQNLYMLRVLLQAHGYQVDEAADGALALSIARRNPPDLIVSDLLMPVLDGYALLRYWRADERLKAIPFVVYTATYTEPQDEKLAMALGADAFVIKPTEPEQLMARIEEVMARRARGEATTVGSQVEESQLLKQYNEVLIRKLEDKLLQLEQVNQDLQQQMQERERTEAALRHSEELLRAVTEGTLDAVFVKDRNGRYLLVNEAISRYFGKPPHDIIGNDDAALFDAQSVAIINANDQAVMQANSAITFEEALTVAGSRRLFLATKAPYRDERGNVTGVVGIAHDITDRRSLEEQLRQSHKMEAIGRLAGGVAHDFNNLLTVIASHSEMILDRSQPGDPVQDHAKAIRDAGKRASALTRQLLGFSRQVITRPEILDLNDVVAETGDLLRRLIGSDITLMTVRSSDLAAVAADRSQVDQVLMNLAVNARDAMPKGGKLTIETANVTLDECHIDAQFHCGPGRYVMLAVTDTGTGIPPEIRARIFEPFFTTKDVGRGTGLGLSLVFGIVQQSGGCIQVDSEPGRGTTFRIYLPLADGKPTPVSDPRLQASRGTETILVVEDDEDVRDVATGSLELHGYDVITAFDGREALRIAQNTRERIDLVLTDVVMPNISGSELARQLRQQFPQIKVLFMSGHHEDAVVRDGVLGATLNFIQKPYTPLSLAQKVREVLDQT